MAKGCDLSRKGPFGDIVELLQLAPESSHPDLQRIVRNRLHLLMRMRSCSSMRLDEVKSLEAEKEAYKAVSMRATQRRLNGCCHLRAKANFSKLGKSLKSKMI